MGKRKNKTSAHTIIQHMEDGKKVTNVLDMSQEEFESLVNQYSGGVHREQKYIPFTQAVSYTHLTLPTNREV